MKSFGLNHCEQGRFDKKMNCYKEVLNIWATNIGINHIHAGQTFNDIGIVDFEKGEYIVKLEPKFDSHHNDVVYTYHCIGNAYPDMNNANESIKYFQKVLKGKQNNMGKDSLKKSETITILRGLCERRGDIENYVLYLKESS